MIEVACNHCGCVMLLVTEHMEGLLSIHCCSCDIHHEIFLAPDDSDTMSFANAIVVHTSGDEDV